MIGFQVLYRGRVQGVGFRATVRDAAEAFGVGGWVRNQQDGSVMLIVQGKESEVLGLLEEVERRMGRLIASVDRSPCPVDAGLGTDGIEIRRSE